MESHTSIYSLILLVAASFVATIFFVLALAYIAAHLSQ